MKSILFVIDTLQTGGAEKSILEITSRLKDFKPIVCVLFTKKPDLLKDFQERSIPIVNLNLKGSNWLLQGRAKLKTVIEEYQPAIVHATLFKSELLTRITLTSGLQILINSFVNDSYVKERYLRQTKFQNLKLNTYKLVDSITAKKVNYFISITNSIAQSNARALGIPLKKIKTIYRGRSVNNFKVVQPQLKDGPFIFLTVARLLKRKGYLELLEAAKILSRRNFDFKILIAGAGHDRAEFEKIVHDNKLGKYVSFLGNRSDVPDLLEKAHCFVFPSHYEGQGGALVEAMLAGKPIVATRIPVFEEQIIDKQSGHLFKLFDSTELAERMYWMFENYAEAKQMGLKAREIAVKRFDINVVIRQYELFYQQLLSVK